VTKVSGQLVANGNVQSFRIEPSSGAVVYLADQDTDQVTELYRTDFKTGANTRLNQDLVQNGGVGPFQLQGMLSAYSN
jgi:hypothetical protein